MYYTGSLKNHFSCTYFDGKGCGSTALSGSVDEKVSSIESFTGHVAVYGLYFETGKSDINAESAEAIAQISTLLKNNVTLKLYVVGHTDNVGTIDANMKLSKDRADAVINALVTKYGIPAARVKSYGVASLAQVASNDSEEGRALNRRVELVKQ